MKKTLLFAAAALAFAACSNDTLDVSQPTQPTTVNDGAIGFDVYTNRTTRAGYAGDVTEQGTTNVTIQKKWDPASNEFGGFGVFGFYTDNNEYDQLATPNFMYNQLVKAHNDASDNFEYWEYDPVKYWPNEYGNTAISDDADKVSFFAYAPYVEVNPSTGKPTANNYVKTWTVGGDTYKDEPGAYGITQLSRNTASGDPIVKYIGSFDYQRSVDLCWGVCEANTWTTVLNGQQQHFELGKPWLDVQRPAQASTLDQATSDQKVKFTFKHALAKMKINIDAFVDGYDATNPLDGKTRIWVRSVRFNGFAMKGALNLNNEEPNKPYWLNYNCLGDLQSDGDIVVYDGRRDGKEGMANAVATNEKSLGLNPQLIQDEFQLKDGAWNDGTDPEIGTKARPGVKNVNAAASETSQPLFANGGVFFVIPLEDEEVEVEIVYDVETIDQNLGYTLSDGATAGSTIENHITKTIKFGSEEHLVAGKGYTVNLHLGMNSVKIDAEVTPWDDIEPATDVDLPANMPTYTAGESGTKANVDLPGYLTADSSTDDYYVFAVNGLVGGETVSTDLSSSEIFTEVKFFSTGAKLVADQDDNKANPSGVVYVKAKRNKYYGVEDLARVDDITITSANGKEVQLCVALLAVKLGLTVPDSKSAGTTFTLKRTDNGTDLPWDGSSETPSWSYTNIDGYTAGAVNDYIRVWVNGAELTYTTSVTEDNEFRFDWNNGELTVKNDVVAAGDQVKVTIKAGDVAEETINFLAE